MVVSPFSPHPGIPSFTNHRVHHGLHVHWQRPSRDTFFPKCFHTHTRPHFLCSRLSLLYMAWDRIALFTPIDSGLRFRSHPLHRLELSIPNSHRAGTMAARFVCCRHHSDRCNRRATPTGQPKSSSEISCSLSRVCGCKGCALRISVGTDAERPRKCIHRRRLDQILSSSLMMDDSIHHPSDTRGANSIEEATSSRCHLFGIL